jgi:hypothetical protein
MPNPMYLKVMGATLEQYNMLKPDEKEEFATEAKRLIAEISDNPTAYTELTENTPVPQQERPNFKRKKRGDN